MNDKEIKSVIVLHRKKIREFMLSEHQIAILKYVANKGAVFSSDVANKFSMSVQSASTTLKTLYGKGYLNRDELTAPSGGKEFEWSCTINFK